MAYEDRIQRMVRRPKSADFNNAKDRYRSRTRGGYPGPRKYGRGLEARGLGSFENQMMMDRLRGPAGMNLDNRNQPRKAATYLDLLKTFKDNIPSTPFGAARNIAKLGARTAADFLTEEEEVETPDYGNMIPIPLAEPDDSKGAFLGDTGYYDDPYYELGSGIIYDSPYGGTIYNPEGFDAGDILRPVEKRQFPFDPSDLPARPFGDARDLNPEISIEFGNDPYGDEMAGTFGLPFNLFQDPTADGGIIDYFGRKIQGDEIDEENYEPYQEPTLEEKRRRFMESYG